MGPRRFGQEKKYISHTEIRTPDRLSRFLRLNVTEKKKVSYRKVHLNTSHFFMRSQNCEKKGC